MPPPAELAQRIYALVTTIGIGPAAAALDTTTAALRETIDGVGPVRHAPRRWDESTARAAFELALQVGTNQAAAQLGSQPRVLREVWDRYDLGRPTPLTPTSSVFMDRATAEAAMALARQEGTKAAARAYYVGIATLYRAWDFWGLGRVTDDPHTAAQLAQRNREHLRALARQDYRKVSGVRADRATAEAAMELARREGLKTAARAYGVCINTLRKAWKHWELGRPTDDPEAAARAARLRLAALKAAIDGHWQLLRAVNRERRRLAA